MHNKHPRSLWWLATIFSLFMFSFGSILASLVLYLHHDLHIGYDRAYAIFGAFASMVWTLPLLGGYLSGKFGHRNTAGVGIVVIVSAFVALLIPGVKANAIGLACFIVGNALFTPALWCLVDQGYSKDDHRREGGFTYFYLLFNLGAVVGILLGGVVADHFGFRYEIAMNLIMVALACILYMMKAAHFEAHPGRRNPHSHSLLVRVVSVAVAALVLVPVAVLLLNYTTLNQWLLYALSLAVVLLMLVLAVRYKDKLIRHRIYAFMLLVLISIGFWTLYNLEPSLISVFASQAVDRTVFGFTIPATSFFAFEGLFVILIGLIFSRMWQALSDRGRDLSLPTKFSLSLSLIGLGFLWIDLGTHVFGHGHHLPALWFIFAYAFFASGELMIGPIGISMVGKLAPAGREGLMMGVWQLYQGLAAVFGGLLAAVVVTPKHTPLLQLNHLYDHLFISVGVAGIVVCLIALCFSPMIRRLIVD